MMLLAMKTLIMSLVRFDSSFVTIILIVVKTSLFCLFLIQGPANLQIQPLSITTV